LAMPGAACLAALLVGPLMLLVWESILPHVSGRIGATGDGVTLQNYREILDPAYALYFYDTFRIGLVASLISLIFGYPIAFRIATEPNSARRRLYITFFVTMMFLSVLARVYSIALTFGPVGFLRPIS